MIFKDSQWMSLWFQGLNCSWNHEGVSFKILSSTQIKFLYINFYLQFMKQLYLDTRVAHTDLGVFWGSNPGLDFPWRSDMDPIFLEVGSGPGLTLTRFAILPWSIPKYINNIDVYTQCKKLRENSLIRN